MNTQRPFIISFIGYLSALGALLSLFSLLPKLTEGIGVYFPPLPPYLMIPFLPEELMRMLISIALLITAYGFLRLKKWGYWLMVGSNVYFLMGWLIAFKVSKQNYVFINPLSSMIGLIFIVPTIKYFSEKQINHNNSN